MNTATLARGKRRAPPPPLSFAAAAETSLHLEFDDSGNRKLRPETPRTPTATTSFIFPTRSIESPRTTTGAALPSSLPLTPTEPTRIITTTLVATTRTVEGPESPTKYVTVSAPAVTVSVSQVVTVSVGPTTLRSITTGSGTQTVPSMAATSSTAPVPVGIAGPGLVFVGSAGALAGVALVSIGGIMTFKRKKDAMKQKRRQ